jgi:hypothetical protein
VPNLEQLGDDPSEPGESSIAAAPRSRPPDTPSGGEWLSRMSRLLGREIRGAVATGVLTTAEAEQLLARLMLVIDQTMTPTLVSPLAWPVDASGGSPEVGADRSSSLG